VDGEIQLSDVGLNWNRLPAPIQGLNGSASIEGSRLIVKGLSGAMQGNEVQVEGEIAGTDVFWNDAQVSAVLDSRLDFEKLGPYLTQAQREQLDAYKVKGGAQTQILVEGHCKTSPATLRAACRCMT
jgi:hypothetical protein